jgi:hypothetical protein
MQQHFVRYLMVQAILLPILRHFLLLENVLKIILMMKIIVKQHQVVMKALENIQV